MADQMTYPRPGFRMTCGRAVLDATNPTVVTTGLRSCKLFLASLVGVGSGGKPTATVLTHTINQGDVSVFAWKPTDSATTTLVSAAGAGDVFDWIAFGDE